MMWVRETFGGSLHNRARADRARRRRVTTAWTISGAKARGLAKELVPFLREKRRQAEILVASSELLIAAKRARRTPEQVARMDAERRALVDELTTLKRLEWEMTE